MGTEAVQYVLVITRAGAFSCCRGISSIGAQGGGKEEISTTQTAAEAENISSTSPKGPLEAGREDSKPQREQHEEKPGRKIRLP